MTTKQVTKEQAILLAGLQALCISADQEWCRQEGKLTEFDKGWFMGQIQTFDFYTEAEKEAIHQCRQYIANLSIPAPKIDTSGERVDSVKPCVCGEPATVDVVHRKSGPCYVAEVEALAAEIAEAELRKRQAAYGAECMELGRRMAEEGGK